MKVETEMEENAHARNVGRKLFFSTKSSSKVNIEVPSIVINTVNSLFDKVAISNDDGAEKNGWKVSSPTTWALVSQ